jgi:hypothetical protein
VLTIPFVLFVEMNCKRNRHMATLGEINVAQTGHGPWKGIVLFGFFLVTKFSIGILQNLLFSLLVEVVHFVPNSPLQAPKIVKLRHFYVIVVQKNVCMTPFRENILWKNSKNRIL